MYGKLDAGPIYWVKPITLWKNAMMHNRHYFYSPACGQKFLDFADICPIAGGLGPKSPNPRNYYLIEAERIDPRTVLTGSR